ncbi:hypothetical protein DFH08DRAFT_964153 [Mycena albidolilacea]|uniref:Uncharacterized protein n=1 Tax=Mycena albidolilacea TaxID=1033008 RepID=A0AAD6ZTL5_9AGAR|nr:hypothetical protein DFH08DRAFT_964153 [Mycena albidolilacea]
MRVRGARLSLACGILEIRGVDELDNHTMLRLLTWLPCTPDKLKPNPPAYLGREKFNVWPRVFDRRLCRRGSILSSLDHFRQLDPNTSITQPVLLVQAFPNLELALDLVTARTNAPIPATTPRFPYCPPQTPAVHFPHAPFSTSAPVPGRSACFTTALATSPRARLLCDATPVPFRFAAASLRPFCPTFTTPLRPPPVRCHAHPIPPPPVPTSALRPPPPCRHARPSPIHQRSRPSPAPVLARPPPRRHTSLLHDCAAAHPPMSRPHLITAPSARPRPRLDTPMRCHHTVSASLSGSLPGPIAQSRLHVTPPTLRDHTSAASPAHPRRFRTPVAPPSPPCYVRARTHPRPDVPAAFRQQPHPLLGVPTPPHSPTRISRALPLLISAAPLRATVAPSPPNTTLATPLAARIPAHDSTSRPATTIH